MKNLLTKRTESNDNIVSYHVKNENLSNIDKLLFIQGAHEIWNNPLLNACSQGQLDITDYRFIFSQYYYYSKNFTKLLSACMLNCDNDYYRSMLSVNLWEEGGGLEIEKRHSEQYRSFLRNHLQINIDTINFETYSNYFFDKYLDLCLNRGSIISTAALSFGTEGIVSRLYTIFYRGLKSIGLNDDQLTFFRIHIECDDEHAKTLEEMVFSYQFDKEFFSFCEKGMIQALDLRDQFFTNIYESLQFRKLKHLIKRVNEPLEYSEKNDADSLHNNINQENKNLYHNIDVDNKINFSVQRVPFKADVLDPRLVVIPAGFRNEFHSHAHETVFLIIEGAGEIRVGDKIIAVNKDDLFFVPRWIKHQVHNTGEGNFRYFAVTDFGFTKAFPQNSEEIYRLNKENVNFRN